MGHKYPTPIQEKAIPIALQGRDVLGLAQTGTGKSLAFILPIIQRITDQKILPGVINSLILVPTRELAEQISQTIAKFTSNTKIKTATIYGGVSKIPQSKLLRGESEIIVACPGRLLDHIRDNSVNLSKLEILVLDEADTMCDMGFLQDIRRIISCLPKKRQTLFFAATMPDEIRVLADNILNNNVTIELDIKSPVKTVSHVLYPISSRLKTKLLIHILKYTATGQVIIFTRTKFKAEKLTQKISKAKYKVVSLQGNMSQNKRNRAIEGFRNGKFDILVATDLASRGLDISAVSHVINFDIPNTVDIYVHRIGRTGRAQKDGKAFTLIVPEDKLLVKKIELVLGKTIDRFKFPDFDYNLAQDNSDSKNNKHKNFKNIDNNTHSNNKHNDSVDSKNTFVPRLASQKTRKRKRRK